MILTSLNVIKWQSGIASELYSKEAVQSLWWHDQGWSYAGFERKRACSVQCSYFSITLVSSCIFQNLRTVFGAHWGLNIVCTVQLPSYYQFRWRRISIVWIDFDYCYYCTNYVIYLYQCLLVVYQLHTCAEFVCTCVVSFTSLPFWLFSFLSLRVSSGFTCPGSRGV